MKRSLERIEMKAEEAIAGIFVLVLLYTFIMGVGCATVATIKAMLTDSWEWSVKAIHFLLLAYLSWKALVGLAKGGDESEGDNK